MIPPHIFSPPDHSLALQTLATLSTHEVSAFVLTGGLAIEHHIASRGGKPILRPPHDLDFLVATFDQIPQTLAPGYLLRHVHPDDPPGKTLLQCVDPETRLRIDVFRSYGGVIDRAIPYDFPARIISAADLTARAARLSWDLTRGLTVSPKYVRDFERLAGLVAVPEVEPLWPDHRTPGMPGTFREAAGILRTLIPQVPHLLAPAIYSTDPTGLCSRCRPTPAMPLADPTRILALLGYC